MDIRIRRATPADVPQIRTVLTRALADDPMFLWIFPPDVEQRLSRVAIYVSAQVERLVAHGVVHVADDAGRVVGAAQWRPPGAAPLDALPVPSELAPILCGPQRASEVAQGLARAREGAPQCPGAYLATLAVLDTHRGAHLGSRLLEAGRAALPGPTWLETTKESNVRFYEHLGYALVHEAPLGDGSATLSRMAAP